jgi:CSLREA domain-containing protein
MRKNSSAQIFAWLLVLSVLVVVWAAPFSPVRADTFLVTKTADTNDGVCDADCSLREAIIAANANPGADTVSLPTGLYVLTIAGSDDAAALGDLDITGPLTINGQSYPTTIVDGNGLGRVLDVHSSAGEVSLSSVSIMNGSTTENGGGILCRGGTLILEGANIEGNSADNRGGGISATGCDLTLMNTLLIYNSATSVGGGLYAFESVALLEESGVASNESADQGGGIYAYDSTLTLVGTAVGRNYSVSSGGGIVAACTVADIRQSALVHNTTEHSGGGIFLYLSPSTLVMKDTLVALNEAEVEGAGLFLVAADWAVIENSTISGNRADTYGGGVNTRIPLTITHSTIANNVADAANQGAGSGGGLFAYLAEAVVQMSHTILANNQNPGTPEHADCFKWSSVSEINSHGYNLVEVEGGCTFTAPGDIVGQDPLLGPLQENGGPTLTHGLAGHSPARDAGDPAFVPPPAWDQRGQDYPRVVRGRIDIGAIEAWVPVWLPATLR